MPVVYLPVQDRFQLSCTAVRKLPVEEEHQKVFFFFCFETKEHAVYKLL